MDKTDCGEMSMRTPASIAGHPIHPMIVPLAIGGFILSFVFDIVCLATGATDPWATVAYYTMIGGIAGGLIAAVFGFIDLISLPHGPVKRTAYMHMGLNLFIVVLFLCNALLRHDEMGGNLTIWMSGVGVALLAVSGWLGGKMVYEDAVGVSDGELPARRASNRHIEALRGPSPSRSRKRLFR
jgi:uncharacterized membrane protein